MSETNNAVSMTANIPEKPKYDSTISSFLELLELEWSKLLRFNEWTNKQEICKNGDWRWITDQDEACIRLWFQEKYGIQNRNNLKDALDVYMERHRVNPLQSMISDLQWDGHPRISRFLRDVMNCDDIPAVAEISKMIFAGGIRRAFEPGCKFDYMPVLIGRQGCGKSTIVEWLAMGFPGKVKTFSGAEAIESLFGVWIGEVDELSALKRTKDREEIKSFLSTTTDSYRVPYAKYPQQIRRKCILIGTTNSRSFLNDLTGNRRYFPVEVHSSANIIYSHEDTIRKYIAQCWAEAYQLYKEGRLSKDYDHQFDAEFDRMRSAVSMEDADIGLIEAYLDRKAVGEIVCNLKLWVEACGRDRDRFQRSDGQRLSEIMDNCIKGWERIERTYFSGYGTQRGWKKTGRQQ